MFVKGCVLIKVEVVEVLFYIYVLKGIKMKLVDVCKFIWLNFLDDGCDIM